MEVVKKQWRGLLAIAKKHAPRLHSAFLRVQLLGISMQRRMSRYSAGPFTYGTPRVFDVGGHGASFRVGSYTSIGPEVSVLLGAEHTTGTLTTYPFVALWPEAQPMEVSSTSKGSINIGSDVWIGHRVVILSGVTIGDGCIVGAGSVVTRDLPPYSVAAGSTCRVLRMRFKPEVIDVLLQLRWWDWPRKSVARAIPHLLSGDVHELAAFAEREGLPTPPD